MTSLFTGSGPGPRTLDGCSVELYRQLPYLDELEECRRWFEPGVHVLELGCGPGRLTRRLLEWDVRVTAVDNSAEMLSLVPDEDPIPRAPLRIKLGPGLRRDENEG